MVFSYAGGFLCSDLRCQVVQDVILAVGQDEGFVGQKEQRVKSLSPAAINPAWRDLVEQKQELWPIQLLVPNGAYIH